VVGISNCIDGSLAAVGSSGMCEVGRPEQNAWDGSLY